MTHPAALWLALAALALAYGTAELIRSGGRYVCPADNVECPR